MALVTTPGDASAESYISVEDATEYHTQFGNLSTWDAFDVTDHEAALRRATVWLDGVFKPRWPGERTSDTQALDWPRTGAKTFDYHAIAEDAIPIAIARATAEAALREVITPGVLSKDYVADKLVASKKVGPMSITYRDTTKSETGQLQVSIPVVDRLLSEILLPKGGLPAFQFIR